MLFMTKFLRENRKICKKTNLIKIVEIILKLFLKIESRFDIKLLSSTRGEESIVFGKCLDF